MGGSGLRTGSDWFVVLASGIGVVLIYVALFLDYRVIALAASLAAAVLSINHYLIRRYSGRMIPYWLFFVPLLIELAIISALNDWFAGVAAAYSILVVYIIGFSSPKVIEQFLRDLFATASSATAVASAAAVTALTYVYVYGVDTAPIGVWAVAGPVIEYFLVRQSTELVGGGFERAGYVLGFSVGASLMFLPPPALGAYASAINSLKGFSRGRRLTALIIADYLARAAFIVLMNAGRVRLPSGEALLG